MRGFPGTGPALLVSMAVLLRAAPVLAAAQHNGAVVITTDPPGGEVYVDGERVGSAPLKRELMSGDHLVEIKWANGQSASQVVKVAEGTSSVVKLSPAAAAPAAPAPAPAPTPAPALVPALSPDGSAQPAPAPAATPPAATPAAATPPPGAATPPAPPQTNAETSPPDSSNDRGLVSHLPDDVLSPAVPHRLSPTGVGVGLGMVCDFLGPDSTASFGGCGFAIRFVPVDFSIGQVNIDFVPGELGGSGGRFGFALGSKFFPVGGPSTAFAMAIRGQAAAAYQSFSGASANCSNYGLCTVGGSAPFDGSFFVGQVGGLLQLSYGVTRSVAIDGSVAAGVSYGTVDEEHAPLGYGDHSASGVGGYFHLLAGVRL